MNADAQLRSANNLLAEITQLELQISQEIILLRETIPISSRWVEDTTSNIKSKLNVLQNKTDVRACVELYFTNVNEESKPFHRRFE